jgi:hypothetical protein
MCSTGCTDVTTDPTNCGGCGIRCTTGQTCSLSRCTGGTTGSPAGNACTSDTTCGTLQCPAGLGFCTAQCTDGSASSEQSQCGGSGSTCLLTDDTTGDGLCLRGCTAGSATSCRAGFVCTGLTLFVGATDTTGCYPHCTSNAQCPTGTVCDVRWGTCGQRAANLAALADGSPCNPTITTTVPGEMEPRNTQCRGRCLGVSATDRTRGICGSLINLGITSTCPDPNTLFSGAMGDDLIGCIFRSCTRSADCSVGTICIYQERMGAPITTGPRVCNYPTAAQPTAP